jgi:hypothetical protein
MGSTRIVLVGVISLMIVCLVSALVGKHSVQRPYCHEKHWPLLGKNKESSAVNSEVSRRALFQNAAICATLIPVLANPYLTSDGRANAAAPVTVAEADSFTAKAQRLLRPKPPKALRPKLDRDFAVLLMRSSYNALDQLDCVAMVSMFAV